MSSWRQPHQGDLPSFRFGPSPWSSLDDDEGRRRSLQRSEDSCSYTRSVTSRCFIEANSDGNPVKKCEKTEQLLRNCMGRPQEIVESKTEFTEEDLPNGWITEPPLEGDGESFQMIPPPFRPFQGMDPFSRGLSDGIESFMQAAEEMMDHAFNQLGFYRYGDRNDHPGIPRRIPGKHNTESRDSNRAPPKSNNMPSQKIDFNDFRSYDEA